MAMIAFFIAWRLLIPFFKIILIASSVDAYTTEDDSLFIPSLIDFPLID